MRSPLNVGVVGCGTISSQYCDTFDRVAGVSVVAVADIDGSRARDVAAERGVRALSVDALIADADVELVLNLTIPAAHADVAVRAVAAGKSVYGEKPLATDTKQARAMLEAGRDAGVLVGCAPDTVLGSGIQTARKAIDDGMIGAPVAAIATMITPGHERWHAHPDFYYQPGGGPLFDMGPYYLTALVTMFGPVASVTGAASHTRDTRTISSGPRDGEQIPVDVDTHVAGVLVHVSGVLSSIIMSFDGTATRSPHIEVHGTHGSLIAPDPNTFNGDVEIISLGQDDWRTLPASAGYIDGARGFGVVDLAAEGAGARASGELAFHVLDVMESLLTSAGSAVSVSVTSTCDRPSAVPLTTPTQAPGT